jgi:hypothetical protein
MAAVMGWVAKSRNRSRPVSEKRRLVHPPSTLIIGLAGFSFFFGIAVVSNIFANDTTTPITTAVFLGFAVLFLVIVADYVLARHEVSHEGMKYGRLIGKRGSFNWSEVASVHYAPGMKWFKLETQSGEVARVSAMHLGLAEFARTVLEHVPSTAIEPETSSVLQATAAGDPPNVWN